MNIQYLKPSSEDVPSKDFQCNLAGINHESLTGGHRQANIPTLQRGQPLILVRNYNNPHDRHATLALSEAGKDVGYVPAHLADRIARVLDAKRAVTAVVDDVEEFTTSSGSRLWGVRITITTWKAKPKPRTPRSTGGQVKWAATDGGWRTLWRTASFGRCAVTADGLA